MASSAALKVVSDPTNGGEHDIDLSQPYRASVTISGVRHGHAPTCVFATKDDLERKAA